MKLMKSQGARSRQPTEREVAATPNRSSFSSGRLTRGGAARQSTSALVPVREKQARCQACGRQHSTSTCKFRLYTCRVCNKEGHLMKVCPKYRSGQVCAQPVKRLEETSSGEDTDEEIREVALLKKESLRHKENKLKMQGAPNETFKSETQCGQEISGKTKIG
ncbi:unnamed protein product, partial [Iphiclides podalirius]